MKEIICPITEDMVDMYVSFITEGIVDDDSSDIIFAVGTHCSECPSCDKKVKEDLELDRFLDMALRAPNSRMSINQIFE